MKRKHNPTETGRIGRRGVVVIPARLRRRFGLDEGSLIVVEEKNDGVLIRPAVVLPVEVYSPARRAQFLLNNAVDAKDYQAARAAVKAMGIDPDTIDHVRRTAKRRGGRGR